MVQKGEIATARLRPAKKKPVRISGKQGALLPTKNTSGKVDRELTVERLKKKEDLVCEL